MPGYKDVFKSLCKHNSVEMAMHELKMPPSKLKRILKSPRFRQAVECERLGAYAMATLHAGKWVGEAIWALGKVMEGCGKAEQGKAASAILRAAFENKEVFKYYNPGPEGLKSLAATLVQIGVPAGQIPAHIDENPADNVKKLENTPQNGDQTMRIPARLGSSEQARKP